jgi:uncharacterized protein YndB with AHSA1/START domain
MLKIILAVIAVFVIGVLALAASKPDAFRVQRSIDIKAPPEKVFALLNDFHLWSGWSPWENIDPAMQRTFSGLPSGKGSVYEWKGDNKVGQGRMEIIETTQPSKILIKLDFLKPFEAHNTAEYTLETRGDTIRVTWAMFGSSPFVMKIIHIFISMDSMVGKDFETGLANLKALAEKS